MKVRKLSMALKIFIVSVALLVVTDVVLGAYIYSRSQKMLLTQIQNSAMNTARCIAATIDGEMLEQVQTTEDMDGEAYQTIHAQLTTFLENGGVEYCYTVRQTADGFVFVVDSDPEAPGLPGDEFEDEEDTNRAIKGETTVNDQPYEDEWGRHISAYSPIYVGDTVVGLATVDVDANWIDEQTTGLEEQIIVICLVLLVIGVLILFMICRHMSRRFRILNEKVEGLSDGDGDLTRLIEITSGDEYEVIGENVNKLVGYIREIMLNISKSSLLLQDSSKSIAENMDEAEESASAMSSTMEDMSATMQETSASLIRIDDLMNEITDAFGGVMQKIGDGRDYSGNIREHAIGVGSRAQSDKDDASEKVEVMADAVREKIEKSKAVEQIDVLTEKILSITGQTNLLALNASIEAARAGEAGRGFAVVADEIGHLAQDSAAAAAEIQNVSAEVIRAVNELAEEAQAMIEFINGPAIHGYEELVDTSSDYRETAEKFDEIMTEFSELTAGIRANIESIRTATNEVSGAMEASAQNITQVTEQTMHMANNMRSIDSDANSSREVSDALSGEVGKFKLE